MKAARSASLCILLTVFLAACGPSKPPPDALTRALDRELAGAKRISAMQEAAAASEADARRLPPVRAKLGQVVLDQSDAPAVRIEAISVLLADPDPAFVEQVRAMLRALLPREGSRTVVAYICNAAAAKNWTEFGPALVRSYSRVVPEVSENERAERVALRALFPGQPVEQVAMGVFLNPSEAGKGDIPDLAERCRIDAWDLLARLDPSGEFRAAAIASPSASAGVVSDLRACLEELRAIPLTGEQVRWLQSLHDSRNAANKAWWSEAASSIRTVPSSDAARLGLWHAEAIRWAATAHPDWLTAPRETLLADLRSRLEGRAFVQRSGGWGGAKVPPDTLAAWEAEMEWADVLAVLAVDELVHTRQIAAPLFQYAAADRADDMTEYGGLLAWLTPGSQAAATLYPPRPTQRLNDDRFIASEDMIRASDRALAHFHFHVQKRSNREAAGPSPADIEYAARFGRLCIVFTSVDGDTLNADYYDPRGRVIDLGLIGRSPSP